MIDYYNIILIAAKLYFTLMFFIPERSSSVEYLIILLPVLATVL